MKDKDRERRDLEGTVDVLRKELNKTEQARKDASIKVETFICASDVIIDVWIYTALFPDGVDSAGFWLLIKTRSLGSQR